MPRLKDVSLIVVGMNDDREYAIQAEGLVKRFGETTALDGVDLAVPAGSVSGVLGPNGAGKTTAVRVLATLLRADAGRAFVGGHDVATEPVAVRALIGRLLGLARHDARARARELLERFGLADAAGERA